MKISGTGTYPVPGIPMDIYQLISLEEGSYTLVLQWDDGSDPDQAVTETDLDIFLTDNSGSLAWIQPGKYRGFSHGGQSIFGIRW